MSSKGVRAYDGKERREVRLRNHVAKDLGNPKYRQRIKEPKKKALIEKVRLKELEKEIRVEFEREDYEEDYQAPRAD